jgi:hypothetical protein
MNGRALGNGEKYGMTNRFFKTEGDIRRPSDLWVFIDEDQGTINDGMFVVRMDHEKGLQDVPSRKHGYSYKVSFADGHSETIPILTEEVRNWKSGDDALPETKFDGHLNPDIQKLRSISTFPE